MTPDKLTTEQIPHYHTAGSHRISATRSLRVLVVNLAHASLRPAHRFVVYPKNALPLGTVPDKGLCGGRRAVRTPPGWVRRLPFTPISPGIRSRRVLARHR